MGIVVLQQTAVCSGKQVAFQCISIQPHICRTADGFTKAVQPFQNVVIADLHSCGFLPAVTGNRTHGKTGQIADSGRNHIAGQHLADDVLIAAVCGDGGIDDSSFQQTGKKPSGDSQIIALFGIRLQLQRFNDAEVLCIIAPRHNSATLKDRYILRTGSDVHLKATALVELNVP